MSESMSKEPLENDDDQAVSWSEISSTLSMLAQIVNVVPDETWVPSLVETIAALGDEAPGCTRMKAYLTEHSGDSLDDLVRDLAVNWTLVFRGMNPAHGPRPPYAGAWLSDDGTGVKLMLSVNSLYVEEGLGVSGSHLNRLDYIGVELEFMAHLVGRFAKEGTDELASRIVDFEDRFILSWLPRFRAQVEERCNIEFWKGYLELVVAVLEDVRKALSVK